MEDITVDKRLNLADSGQLQRTENKQCNTSYPGRVHLGLRLAQMWRECRKAFQFQRVGVHAASFRPVGGKMGVGFSRASLLFWECYTAYLCRLVVAFPK